MSGIKFHTVKLKIIGNVSPCEDCPCVPMCIARDQVDCKPLMDYLKSDVYPNFSTFILKCTLFKYSKEEGSKINLVREERNPDEVIRYKQQIKAHIVNLSHTHRFRVFVISVWFKAVVFIAHAYMRIRIRARSLKIRVMGGMDA